MSNEVFQALVGDQDIAGPRTFLLHQFFRFLFEVVRSRREP